MAKENITPGRIRKLTAAGSQVFLWDTLATGLGVRATPAGAKSYIFQAKVNGKAVRITIGDVDAWPLESVRDRETGAEITRGARQEARRLKNLTDQGIDPREQKRERIAAHEAQQAEARREAVTVKDAWDEYVKARTPVWSPRNLQDHNDLAHAGGEPRKRGSGVTSPGPLAELMFLRLADLTAERLADWLKQENIRRPTRAALAYRLLRAFIRWAAEMPAYKGAAHVEAVGGRVARDNVRRARTKEGDSLQREQLRPWFDAVRKLGNPSQAAYLQALLLTGARKEELAGLRWADVDFQWKSLSLSDKVEEAGRTIPLTPYLASLLSGLPRRNEWVFSSDAKTSSSGRITNPHLPHVRALEAAGLPHVTIHGLRRSFGTLAEWVECPVGVVAQIMGHKPSALAEKHYRRRPLDLLRVWHVRIEAWMLEQAGIPQPEEQAGGLRLVEGGKSA